MPTGLPSPLRLLSMGGSPSSGSTMLADLVDSIPGIHCGPEMNLFSIGAAFDWNERFKSVLRAGQPHHCSSSYFLRIRFLGNVEAAGIGLTRTQALRMVEQAPDLRAFLEDLAAHVRRHRGRPVQILADKSPTNVAQWAAFCRHFPDGMFVHIVRDGRAVVASLMRRGYSLLESALIWMHQTHAGAGSAANAMTLRYEDVTVAPYATAASLGRRLGLDTTEAAIAEAFAANVYRRSLGRLPTWRVPEFACPVPGLGWQETLSRDDVRLLETLELRPADAEPGAPAITTFRGLLQAFGYEPATTGRPPPSAAQLRARQREHRAAGKTTAIHWRLAAVPARHAKPAPWTVLFDAGDCGIRDGLRFERASATAKPDADGRFTAVPAGQPRLVPIPGFDCGVRGLLLEPERANRLGAARAIDDAAWAESAVTRQPAEDPRDGDPAIVLRETADMANHRLLLTLPVPPGGAPLCFSVHARPGTRMLRLTRIAPDRSFARAVFSPTLDESRAAAFGASAKLLGHGVESAGGGWHRAWMASDLVTGNGPTTLAIELAVEADPGSGGAFAGDGTGAFTLWHAQCEAGARPTTPILLAPDGRRAAEGVAFTAAGARSGMLAEFLLPTGAGLPNEILRLAGDGRLVRLIVQPDGRLSVLAEGLRTQPVLRDLPLPAGGTPFLLTLAYRCGGLTITTANDRATIGRATITGSAAGPWTVSSGQGFQGCLLRLIRADTPAALGALAKTLL